MCPKNFHFYKSITDFTVTIILSEENISIIESFSKNVRTGLDHATFEVKRKRIELLDVRGKLAIENEGKAVSSEIQNATAFSCATIAFAKYIPGNTNNIDS